MYVPTYLMAVSKDFIVKEESLCCSICLELFDKPKTLPCLHSFCNSCLLGYIEKTVRNKQTIHCPLCRAVTKSDIKHFDNVEKWVEGLPVNFMLVSILNDRRNRMSDGVKDCGPCLLGGTKIPAVVQCFECSEKLCEHCKTFHQRVKSLSSHKLYDIGVGPKDIAKLDVLRSVTKCPEHQREIVRYICKDHDQLCCNECAIIKHRKCDHMVSIADELATLATTGQETNTKLDKINEGLEKLIEHETKHQSSVQASVKKVDEKLLKLKKTFDEEFKKLKEAITSEVAEKSGNILKKSKMQIIEVEALKSEVDTSRSRLDVAREHGETTHMYLMERALKKEVKRHEEALQRLGTESSVSNLNVVEDMSEQDMAKTIASCFHVEEITSQNSSLGIIKLGDKDPVLVYEEKLTVSQDCARRCIWIDNYVVITLQEVKQIQLFVSENETFKYKETKQTRSEPWSLREIDNSRFAVCFPKNKTIDIMDISGEESLRTVQTFGTDKDIWDISFDNTKSEIISLSRSGAIDIYKLDGTMARSLSFSSQIVAALSNAYSICFDVNTNSLHISSHGLHKLVAVGLNGTTVFEYSSPKLKYPWHSDFDANGDIWVPFYYYDGGVGVIHQIDSNGKLVREIKLAGHGLCVCFNRRKTKFLVLTSKRPKGYFIQMFHFK